MNRSFRIRLAVWFATSVWAISAVLFTVTYFHLRHELKVEQWERVHPDHPDFVLHGTYSEDEIDDIADHIIHISLLLSVPFMGLAIGLGWYLANKSLRPISVINEQLNQIEASRLDVRVYAPDVDSELEAITRNINALLERIEESYRGLTEFSARVAHELRTPLTLMRLQLEAYAASIDADVAESLQDELMRLEGFVEQCLLIARAERGQVEVKPERLCLRTLIDDVIEPFHLLAREAAGAIFLTGSGTPEIVADPWILRQVLHNLLSNAIKHGNGSISIDIQQDAYGSGVEIRNPCKEVRSQGTGLGLRIVEALVNAQGGWVWKHWEEDGVFHCSLHWRRESEGAKTPSLLSGK